RRDCEMTHAAPVRKCGAQLPPPRGNRSLRDEVDGQFSFSCNDLKDYNRLRRRTRSWCWRRFYQERLKLQVHGKECRDEVCVAHHLPGHDRGDCARWWIRRVRRASTGERRYSRRARQALENERRVARHEAQG